MLRTHTLTKAHKHTHWVQVPAALSSGLQTEHSILFNHMCVSRPAAGCLSQLVCVLGCIYSRVRVCTPDGDLELGKRNPVIPHSSYNSALTPHSIPLFFVNRLRSPCRNAHTLKMPTHEKGVSNLWYFMETEKLIIMLWSAISRFLQ